MARASEIRHPEGHSFIVIRDWQVEFFAPLCKVKNCASALCSLFEYWHNCNIVAVSNGKATDLSIGVSLNYIRDSMLKMYPVNTIRRCLDFMRHQKMITSSIEVSRGRTSYLFKPNRVNEIIHYITTDIDKSKRYITTDIGAISQLIKDYIATDIVTISQLTCNIDKVKKKIEIKDKERIDSYENKTTKELQDLRDVFFDFHEKYEGDTKTKEDDLKTLTRTFENWQDIIPLLHPALEREKRDKQKKYNATRFNVPWKFLENWIKGKCWTIKYASDDEVKTIEYFQHFNKKHPHPQNLGSVKANEYYKPRVDDLISRIKDHKKQRDFKGLLNGDYPWTVYAQILKTCTEIDFYPRLKKAI